MPLELILAVVGATLLAALGVPLVFLGGSSWKWSSLDATARRRVLRAAFGSGGVFGAVAAVVAVVIAAISGIAWLAGAGAILVTCALAAWSVTVAAPLKRVHRLAAQIDDSRHREGARMKLIAIAAAAPSDSVGQSIRISVATVLGNGRLFADARRILESIAVDGLDAHERELRALGLLACCVHTRELAAARAALAVVPQLEPGSTHADAYRGMQAMLLVHEGKPEAAVALLAAQAPDPEVARGHRVVLAHALAAKGDERGMQECFAWLEQRHGKSALERVVDPEGPASAAAWAELQGNAAPYRR